MDERISCETCVHKTVCTYMLKFKEYSLSLPLAPYPVVVKLRCSEYREVRTSRDDFDGK